LVEVRVEEALGLQEVELMVEELAEKELELEVPEDLEEQRPQRMDMELTGRPQQQQ